MVFNLLVGHRRVFVLHRNSEALITLDELKRELYLCLADRAAVTLTIHATEPIDLLDVRAVFSKLYVVLAFGRLTNGLRIEVDCW